MLEGCGPPQPSLQWVKPGQNRTLLPWTVSSWEAFLQLGQKNPEIGTEKPGLLSLSTTFGKQFLFSNPQFLHL